MFTAKFTYMLLYIRPFYIFIFENCLKKIGGQNSIM
jgi:hypothetical protein